MRSRLGDFFTEYSVYELEKSRISGLSGGPNSTPDILLSISMEWDSNLVLERLIFPSRLRFGNSSAVASLNGARGENILPPPP